MYVLDAVQEVVTAQGGTLDRIQGTFQLPGRPGGFGVKTVAELCHVEPAERWPDLIRVPARSTRMSSCGGTGASRASATRSGAARPSCTPPDEYMDLLQEIARDAQAPPGGVGTRN